MSSDAIILVTVELGGLVNTSSSLSCSLSPSSAVFVGLFPVLLGVAAAVQSAVAIKINQCLCQDMLFSSRMLHCDKMSSVTPFSHQWF